MPNDKIPPLLFTFYNEFKKSTQIKTCPNWQDVFQGTVDRGIYIKREGFSGGLSRKLTKF